MTLLMLTGPPDLWGQDCIDFEDIDTELSSINRNCNCDGYQSEDIYTIGETGKITDFRDVEDWQDVFIEDKCFIVSGTLLLPIRHYFINCNFILEEGARIEAGRFISFHHSSFQTCNNDLWEGIKIRGPEFSEYQTSSFIFENNLILDSYYGIYYEDQTHESLFPIIVRDNTFLNNKNAVFIRNEDPEKLLHLILTGNLITQTGTLKNHWEDGPLTDFGGLSIGIRGLNSLISADASSDPCNLRNILYNLYEGFELTSCHATIKANLFKVNQPWSVYPERGIVARGSIDGRSILDQEGWPTSHINSFDGVRYPIISAATSAFIKNNIIEDSWQGISVEALYPLDQLRMSDNHIKASIIGVRVNNYGARGISIFNNQIDIQSTPLWSFGIQFNSIINSDRTGAIGCNTINLEPGHFGIYIQNTENIAVMGNTVNANSDPFNLVSGIEIRGGMKNLIQESIVISRFTSGGSTEVNGIRIVESPFNQFNVNRTYDTDYGFHFSNNCMNTKQIQNEFGNHSVAYYLDPSGITAEQNYTGNRWLGTSSTYDALCEGISSLSLVYEYDNFPDGPSSISPADDWFHFEGTGAYSPIPTIACNTNNIPIPKVKIVDLSELDRLIAVDSFLVDDFSDRRKWQAERYLFRILSKNPSLISGSEFYSFFSGLQTGSIASFQQIWNSIEYYVSADSLLFDDMLLEDSMHLLLLNEVLPLVEVCYQFPDSTDLWEELEAITAQMDSIWFLNLDWSVDWNQSSRLGLSGLMNNINGLSTPNTYAENEKLAITGLVQSYLNPDSLTFSLKSQLSSLAEVCVLEHGPAVFLASSIVNKDSVSFISEVVYCEDKSESRIHLPISAVSDVFSIYPNPARDKFYIEFSDKLKSPKWITLLDANGRELKKFLVPKGTSRKELNVGELPSGFYLLVDRNDGKVQQKSILISR